MKKSYLLANITKGPLKHFQRGDMWILFLLTFISCENILVEHPKSVSAESFYNTASDVEAATNAIYAPIHNYMYTYIAQVESYTDYGWARGSYDPLNAFQGLNPTNMTRVESMWVDAYSSIRNANLVIKNAPSGKSISSSDIDKYVAEAKFLRAFNYFQLVRNWAGVPIRTETNMEEIDLARNTVEEVYNLIIEDLQEAETILPDVPTKLGKPSKWAAKTMLAEVYLQLEMFAEARDKADEVIKANKYSLVRISSTDDLQKIFGPDVVTTSEEIFYIKFARIPNYGNYWVRFINHPGTKFHPDGGSYGQYSDATNLVYKNWDNKDLRKGLWYIWDFGFGPTSLLLKKFIDPEAAGGTGAGNDDPWYRYADLLLFYAEAASRVAGGPTVEAMEALNQVHRRAYGNNPTTPSDVDFKVVDYNAGTFLDLVVKEQGYEFQHEGKRWLCLRRTGKAQEIIQFVKGITIAQKNYLWPIPVSEYNFNKAIDPVKDQNPGY